MGSRVGLGAIGKKKYYKRDLEGVFIRHNFSFKTMVPLFSRCLKKQQKSSPISTSCVASNKYPFYPWLLEHSVRRPSTRVAAIIISIIEP
jgi:hypothetical protein